MSVDCIFSTDKSGHIRPSKIRIEEDGRQTVLLIKNYMMTSMTKDFQMFLCKAVDQGIEKKLKLKYYMKETKWILTEVK